MRSWNTATNASRQRSARLTGGEDRYRQMQAMARQHPFRQDITQPEPQCKVQDHAHHRRRRHRQSMWRPWSLPRAQPLDIGAQESSRSGKQGTKCVTHVVRRPPS